MGGGGGSNKSGRDYSSPTETEEVNADIKREFEETLASLIADKLREINNRNDALCQQRLADLKGEIINLFDDVITLNYAGSVKKHTYIEGASDIDVILQIKELTNEAVTPSQVLENVRGQIGEALREDAKVSVGDTAVTVKYSDGMEIQIVPGVKTSASGSLKIPSGRDTEKWSAIDSKKFTDALTKRNKQCSNQLVPAIKLAKLAIHNANLHDRISGYHIEAMAIDIFRGYKGSTKTSDILRHFFEKAPAVVLKPIKDKTGQSVNVDTYLGRGGSEERKTLSRLLNGLHRRMNSASLKHEKEELEQLFQLPDE